MNQVTRISTPCIYLSPTNYSSSTCSQIFHSISRKQRGIIKSLVLFAAHVFTTTHPNPSRFLHYYIFSLTLLSCFVLDSAADFLPNNMIQSSIHFIYSSVIKFSDSSYCKSMQYSNASTRNTSFKLSVANLAED